MLGKANSYSLTDIPCTGGTSCCCCCCCWKHPGPTEPPSHTPHGGRWSQGWLGFPSCDPWQSSISPLGSSQHKQVTDTGSRNSEPHLHQPLFPLNSSSKQAKLSASQRSLHVPEHASPRQTWTTLHRLVLFQFGCRNCLEPLKRIQLCIHCISGLRH